MNIFITAGQIIVSLSLIALILLQAQGGGLGSAFGGAGFYSSKRGVEKIVLYLTVVLTGLFFALSILNYVF